MLLSTAYFPPIEYFAAMAKEFTLSPDRVIASEIWLEACENYQKQTYRNRCKFYAENGVQTLNVPIVHENGTYELPITEIRIDYSTPWVIRTERAIESAYFSSPYFEYYKDGIWGILDSRPERLFELNLKLIRYFLEKTGIKADIHLTDSYVRQGDSSYGEDLRNVIHPKRNNDILAKLGLDKQYYQVFAGRHGFQPNLSIMDLLFNEGPDSILYLKKIALP